MREASFKGRSRRATVGLTVIMVVAIGCASAGAQGAGGLGQGDQFRAVPPAATPEQTYLDLTDWHAAPIEGTPEETAIELGR